MSETPKDRKLRLPTKREVLSIGAAANAAMALLAANANAQTSRLPDRVSNNPAPAHVEGDRQLMSAAESPRMRAIEDWGKLLDKLDKGKIPDVAMNGVMVLPAGTFLAYGPRKGSPGIRVPEGQTGLAEFGQMFKVDGRLVIRVIDRDKAPSHNQFDDGLDSRFIDVDQPGLKVYYFTSMDSNKGYPRVVLVGPDNERNIEFKYEFTGPPPPESAVGGLIMLDSSYATEYMHARMTLDKKPGKLPTLADIPPLNP